MAGPHVIAQRLVAQADQIAGHPLDVRDARAIARQGGDQPRTQAQRHRQFWVDVAGIAGVDPTEVDHRVVAAAVFLLEQRGHTDTGGGSRNGAQAATR